MDRRITVLTDIKDLAELLRGTRLAQVREAGSVLTLEFARAATHARAERRGLFARTITSWSRSRLTLNGVAAVAVTPGGAPPGPDEPLLDCEAVVGGYTFAVAAPDGLRVACRMAQLDGRFSEAPAPAAEARHG